MFKSPNQYITRILEEITLFLSDYIISEIEDINHERKRRAKYKSKILPFAARFVDTSLFTVEKDINQRKNIIGYIGRLSKEKGVINFIEAIPLILKKNDQLEFLIGGTGTLFDEVRRKAREHGYGKMSLTSLIPHEKMPNYLNELKLFVLPSEDEGLPTIILEAMACGTPVLATPVGAVPEVIEDGETGFVLENNSPECIARNVIRVLNYPNLEKIANNARNLIERKYTYEAAVERYRWMLNKIMEK
jgi:glycosyltransferase involved in cell wall biosynthesis